MIKVENKKQSKIEMMGKRERENIDAELELELELDSEPITYEIFMILTCYRFNHKLKYFRNTRWNEPARKEEENAAAYDSYHLFSFSLVIYFCFRFGVGFVFAVHEHW